jgi:nicotinate dehydrogenase subunit B
MIIEQQPGQRAGLTQGSERLAERFFAIAPEGIVVACLRSLEPAQESAVPDTPLPREVAAWLHIAADGMVTGYTGKVDVGQGSRTSLAQVIAEELRLPLTSVRLVMGDTGVTPFDMGTFGSQTTPVMAPRLRKAAARARRALIELAAQHWLVEPTELTITDGRVVRVDTDETLDFARLAAGRKLLVVVRDDEPVELTPPEQWKVAGSAVPKADAVAMVTGCYRYASDLRLPGMLWGKVLRPPAFQAVLVSVDTRAAEAMPGVIVVRDGSFVGVVAPDEWTAERAIAAIRAVWAISPQPSEHELFEYLCTHPAVPQESERGRGAGRSYVIGSIDEGLAEAELRLEATYTVAYIAHAPLETRAALATWDGDRLTVWTGTQRPFGVQAELAAAFQLPVDHVRVIVPDTGSGYGGKHTGDAAIEAARLARAAGRPVKVVWTREEEFTWAYFRPAGVIDVRSGARRDGTVTAWEFHTYNAGPAAIRPVYAFPHQQVEFHPAQSPLRQGSYRALAATANHFARESHLDELAHALGIDPLELRLRNLRDDRLRAVLRAATERFGWPPRERTPGHGYGLACGFEKGSYVATCAEVTVDPSSGALKVVRVVEAFEGGAILNPDNLRNQVEGAIIMGLGGALFEAIHFENGCILNPRFSQYRVPRFSDVPAIETVLLDRKDLPSAGAGETPIVGIAPAVANAIFDTTGVRLRALPLAPDGTVPRS